MVSICQTRYSQREGKMAMLVAETHIDVSSAPGRALPASPLPLYAGAAVQPTLTAATELRVPAAPSAPQPRTKSQALASLAEALDQSRTALNQVLTTWKDWIGKEAAPSAQKTHDELGQDADADEDADEDEDEE
jgi:hypothetical protein